MLANSVSAWAAETIPPSPSPHYIVDESHVLSSGTFQSIDQQLQQFERDTSNQIVIGIYPTMQSENDVAAYAVDIYQAWHIGQKGKDNGALVLVFTQDHKADIATGYGLEGALPDATCKEIIDQQMTPHFKAGDYDGGIQAAVTAIIAATRGEYQGNGSTHLDNQVQWIPTLLILVLALLVLSSIILRSMYGSLYYSTGRVPSWVVPFILFSNLMPRGGGGWSSGGDWGGGGGGNDWGGGGFSGGGGSTGGGGASGSW